jgi:hypothetical protein
MTGEHEFHGETAHPVDLRRFCLHPHSLFRGYRARSGQPLYPFDFYKTQPAASNRREVRVVTEMGNINPRFQYGFEHSPPLFRLNVPSVNIQFDCSQITLLQKLSRDKCKSQN